jgi:hypothetical protein
MKSCFLILLSTSFAWVTVPLFGTGTSDTTNPTPANEPKKSKERIPNELISPENYQASVIESLKVRESRRLTEEEFIAMSRVKGVVVLDARSAIRYEEVHIRGAKNLPYTDMSVDSLAELIPDKETKILIYCNNNFVGNLREFACKSAGSSLNLNTFASLFDYGYKNVYELGPAVDIKKTNLALAGKNVEALTSK